MLWGVLGALALPVVWLLTRLSRRVREASWAATLLLCLTLPIACHAALDAFTSMGSGLGGLTGPLPWLSCLGAGLGALLLAWSVAWLVERLSLERTSRLAALVLACAASGMTLPWRSEYRGPAADGEGARPNVLMVVIDTVRARSMGAFGNGRETSPQLDALAASSTRFTDARSPSNFTFTSHLSMLTGVYPSEHGAWLLDLNYDPQRATHVAEVFNTAGYRTAAFVGTNVLSAATGIDWGFEVYDDKVDPGFTYGKAWAMIHDLQSLAASRVAALEFNGRPHWYQDFQRPADGILESARSWIQGPDERPYFCMLNLYDVHWPYLPADEYRDLLVRPYDGPIDGFAERSNGYPAGYTMRPEDDAHLVDLYVAELLELDTKLGAFFEAIGLEETALLIVADHGEAFGEGGRYEHNDVLEPQVHVPLIVRSPGGSEEALLSSAPVSGIDVAPTLLGLAGLGVPERMRGVDLVHTTPDANRLRLVEDRDHLDAAHNHFAIYRAGFKFVRVGPKAEGGGLFELASDPDSLIDVTASYPELAVELGGLLDAERARWGAESEELRAGAGGAEGLGALGYLGD